MEPITVTGIINTIHDNLWGAWLLILLVGTHVFLTVRTGFIQRKLGLGIHLSVARDLKGEGDVSQFGALATALASTIGTGNIIGVGTAIAIGGPGAVLWMWLTGVFGIATKYAESLIAVKFRVKTKNGTMLGGAMYALDRGLHLKWLAVLFALFASLAAFGIGSGVQANAVATLVNQTFHIPLWVVGFVMTVITALALIGGLKSITRVCVTLVPFMTVIYIAGCIIILALNYAFLGAAVREIVTSAFAPRAVGGGFIGAGVMAAARYGIARGLFSNESGMGSAPIVAAAAKTQNPVRQALVSSTGTFWDTVIVCALTGLVVVSTVLSHADINSVGMDGSMLVHAAFSKIGMLGQVVLTFGLITFAFSTILGWSYYGERCAEYLFGSKINVPYRVLYTSVVFLGSIAALDLVWTIADALNALMAIPNLVAVLLLSGLVAKETRRYLVDGSINDTDDTPVPLRE